MVQYPLIASTVCQGRVIDYDQNTRILSLSDPVKFEVGKAYVIRITKDDGSVSPPLSLIAFARNASFTFDDTEVELLSNPGFTILMETVDHTGADFVVNEIQTLEQKIIITEVKPKGQDRVEITGVFDDERVHADQCQEYFGKYCIKYLEGNISSLSIKRQGNGRHTARFMGSTPPIQAISKKYIQEILHVVTACKCTFKM